MKKIIMLALLCALSACTLGRKEPSVTVAIYDLGPAPAAFAAKPVFPSLALDVRLPPALASSSSLHYRLLYHDRVRLYEYAAARWAGMPAVLVRQRLLQQLGLSSLPAGEQMPCRLTVEMAEFGQVFLQPDQSHGLIDGEARVRGKNGQTLAHRRFRIEKPSPSQDAGGGVLALAAGVDALAAEISGWLRQLDGEAKMAVCRG